MRKRRRSMTTPAYEPEEEATRRPLVDAVTARKNSERARAIEKEAKQYRREPQDKIIRNREVDEAAAELARKRLLPLPPGKKLTFPEVQEWMKLLTPRCGAT